MPFSFPASPSIGEQSTQNGRVYQWTGSAWDLAATANNHTHISSNITDLLETIDDEVAGLLVAGSGINLNYNDSANTLTISATGIQSHSATHSIGGSDLVSLVAIYEFTMTSKPSIATGSNGSYTMTLPSGAKAFKVFGIAGGGGGGSGRRGASGTNRGGGGGGGGGGLTSFEPVAVSSLSTTTLNISVGAGGAGGAAVTTNDTNGNNGSQGGFSTVSFGNTTFHVQSGNGGGGGTTSAGSSGSGASSGIGRIAQYTGENGGTGGLPNGGTTPNVGNRFGNAKGGGGGGGITSADTNGTGGSGGIGGFVSTFGYDSSLSSSPAGGNIGVNGGNAPLNSIYNIGWSGAGGGANSAGSAGSGGNAGYGGGGGGGGASLNGFTSGAGGNGGDGYIRITVWF